MTTMPMATTPMIAMPATLPTLVRQRGDDDNADYLQRGPTTLGRAYTDGARCRNPHVCSSLEGRGGVARGGPAGTARIQVKIHVLCWQGVLLGALVKVRTSADTTVLKAHRCRLVTHPNSTAFDNNFRDVPHMCCNLQKPRFAFASYKTAKKS